MNTITIRVTPEIKKELDKLKVHDRQPYNDLLSSLILFYHKKFVEEKNRQ